MRISTTQMFNQGLRALQDQQTRIARTQEQVSTGKRVVQPSDDPVAAKQLLDLDQSLALTRQYLDNADTARNRLGLEESALDPAGNAVQRVRELVIQAGSDVLTDGDRAALAEEIEERLDELLGIANTRDANNEYLFSGLSTKTRPFTRVAGGGFGYNGDQGSRELQIGPGYRVNVGDSGSEVFVDVARGNGTFVTAAGGANTGSGVIDPGTVTDPTAWAPDTYTVTFTTATTYEVRDGAAALGTAGTFTEGAAIAFNGVETSVGGTPAAGDTFTVSPTAGQDLFQTIENIATALRTTTPGAAAEAQVDNRLRAEFANLDQAADRLREVRAGVGARLNVVESQRDVEVGFEFELQALISQVQDVDMAEAVSRLAQETSILEAAQASFARVQGRSLFDFL